MSVASGVIASGGGVPSGVVGGAAEAMRRATGHLLAIQHADGWWKGELETNVTMDAEDLLLREFLGIREKVPTERTARWIRARQRDDGTWATFHGGPAELSATVEAYTALRLAGDPADAAHMTRAAEFVLDSGGVEATRVFTRLWLALFGEWPWEQLPCVPPEIVLLPPWAPLSIYDFACWARQTVVALAIVSTHRPVRPLPFTIDELRTGSPEPAPPSPWTAAGRFHALDRVLHAYARRPIAALRRTALCAAERWIVERQEADGGWGGIQPPWVYSLIALHLNGYALDHPVIAAGIRGLEGFTIDDGETRRLEACQSPVWDTALALIALADAGVAPDSTGVERGVAWLLDQEVRVGGDWNVRRRGLAPGGWAFEFANVHYPDIDDTAEVVLALRKSAPSGHARLERAAARGVDWVLGMRCRDGAWGAFDADNTARWVAQLPFCDFGEVVDPPTADVTAHVLEMLALEGRPARDDASVAWLLRAQEPDGSWWGRWGVNHVYGTGAVVPALVAAGLPAGDPAIRRAVAWLEAHQNDDGGWGEDLRSYRFPEWIGRGTSTASQTAWALLALLAAGARDAESTRRGIGFLVATQRTDGTWDEPWFTGTGFPWDFSINYHLYRHVFPLTALGRYVRDEPLGRGAGEAS